MREGLCAVEAAKEMASRWPSFLLETIDNQARQQQRLALIFINSCIFCSCLITDLKAFLQEQLCNARDLADSYFIHQQIDILWREHLQVMDASRKSVGLREHGQKDRFIEYKNRGYIKPLQAIAQMRQDTIY